MPLVIEQCAAERPLGPLRTGHGELLGGELLFPLGIGFDNGGDFDRADKLALLVEQFDLHDRLASSVTCIFAMWCAWAAISGTPVVSHNVPFNRLPSANRRVERRSAVSMAAKSSDTLTPMPRSSDTISPRRARF